MTGTPGDLAQMGRSKKPLKKFAAVKKIVAPSDPRRPKVQEKQAQKQKETEEAKTKHIDQTPSTLFFRHNTALGPPYHILLDTNFINFSIQRKLDIIDASMEALYAQVIPYVTDCVIGELEKLGGKYRIALQVARDPRFTRLPCCHTGTYADDCLVNRVTQHRHYIVATCDRGLKQRIRKIPGVPIMYVAGHKYSIEQLPEAYGILYPNAGGSKKKNK